MQINNGASGLKVTKKASISDIHTLIMKQWPEYTTKTVDLNYDSIFNAINALKEASSNTLIVALVGNIVHENGYTQTYTASAY